MKKYLFLITSALTLLAAPRATHAQGMPKELHDNIHSLFDNHSKFTRKVEMTEKGYVAVTESSDPKLAKILREHVSQMRERLQSGLMVRRWDPAFPEFIAHYDNITHRVEATRNGLKIIVTGKTPDAIKVAQNHARIVSDFAANGWKAHDTSHPLALASGGKPVMQVAKPAGDCAQCRKDTAKVAGCKACQKEAAQPVSRPCCLKEGEKAADCQNCRKEVKK